ncbi:MAG: hypothetical protein Q4G16_12300 [Cruoricaptor ignavus]|nr:hypothetical protein [Cruoricaptor ignavus]
MKVLNFLFVLIISVSCSTEKVTLSPMYDGLAFSNVNSGKAKISVNNLSEKTGQVFYASELTAHVSSFPKFGNTALNSEVTNLKFYVKEYVYAMQAHNLVGQEKALYNLEKSYKKIQKLRKYLSTEDDEVINRYLVRIKSNVGQLEALKQDSLK